MQSTHVQLPAVWVCHCCSHSSQELRGVITVMLVAWNRNF